MPEAEGQIVPVTRSREEARVLYDRLSRWYDFIAEPAEKKLREQGLRQLDAGEGDTVLEIGCGTGWGLVALAQAVGQGGRVHGIDLSPGMIRIARSRVQKAARSGRVTLYLGDALNLPFERGSFDGVFMSFTLELFDTPDIPLVLQECRRVLRNGGRLGVVSLSRKEANPAVRLYEWAHARFPRCLDCRPIFVQTALQDAGLQILHAEMASVWSLPVEIVTAVEKTLP